MFGRKRDDEADDTPFWKQRSWVFSAVFLATVLFVAAVSYVTDSGDSQAGAAAAPRKAQKGPLSTDDSGSSKKAPGERPKGCHTKDENVQNTEDPEDPNNPENPERPGSEKAAGDEKAPGSEKNTEQPTAAPKDVAWKPLEGADVPTSPSAGPTRYNGPVWWCYAHTPMGSVMAAHSILSHMSGADWRTVAEQQLIAGENRDEFISQRSNVSTESEKQQAGVYSGFSISSSTKNSTEVRLLIKSPGGSLGGTTVSMRWSGGDWKVKPQPSGSLFSSMTSATSAEGFIRWGAA